MIESCDVIDDVTNRRAVCTFLWVPIGHEPLNRSVSEIFSIKFVDIQIYTHIDTSTDIRVA